MTSAEIELQFTYHPPDAVTRPLYARIRAAETSTAQAMLLAVETYWQRAEGLQAAFNTVRESGKWFASLVDEVVPECYEKHAAIAGIRTAVAAANEALVSSKPDPADSSEISLLALTRQYLRGARWMACAGIAIEHARQAEAVDEMMDWPRRDAETDPEPVWSPEANEHSELVADIVTGGEVQAASVSTLRLVHEVLAERNKQRKKWDDAHDNGHTFGDLAIAAAELAVDGTDAEGSVVAGDTKPDLFGLLQKYSYASGSSKDAPARRRKALVVAAALLVAEAERIERGYGRD